MSIIEVLKETAVIAGQLILEVYNKDFDVEYKDDNSPLTEADKKANDYIVGILQEEFPDYSILAEESKDDLSRLNNDYCFIVDPLDGTKEFVKRNGEFTVNIALTYKGRAIIGVIYVPVSQELFFAEDGKGAFYEKDGKVDRIHVSDRLEDIRLMVSRSHPSEKLKELIERNNIHNIIIAASSLKGCMIARGLAEAYYRFGPTSEWDTAAMQCIVEEAGGVFRQMDGTYMTYNREDVINRKGFYILNNNKLDLGGKN